MATIDPVEDVLFEPSEAPITKPPSRWRNRWRIRGVYDFTATCETCGHVERGEEFVAPHCEFYPSEDVARSQAERELLESDPELVEYLGPVSFP